MWMAAVAKVQPTDGFEISIPWNACISEYTIRQLQAAIGRLTPSVNATMESYVEGIKTFKLASAASTLFLHNWI